uniref:Uncharacterized protein n=1 Tax=Anguilla anguilla TaxID=7936 RepID=A0A0E9S820_ANGAN
MFLKVVLDRCDIYLYQGNISKIKYLGYLKCTGFQRGERGSDGMELI